MSKSEEFRDEFWLLLDQAFSSLYTSTVETQKENIIKSIELFIVNVQEWPFCTNLSSADFFIWLIENFSYILIESGFNIFHTRIISSCTTLINTLSDNPVTFNVAFNTLRQIVQTILNNYNEITSGKCTKVSVSLDICIPFGIKNDFSTIPVHQNSLMSSLLTCFYEVCCQNRELIMSCSSSCISEIISCLMKLLDLVQGDYKLNVAKMLILFISKTSTELSIQEWKVVCSQFTSFNYDQDVKNAFFGLLEILQYKNNIPNINLLLLQSVVHCINTECIANKDDITKWINLGTSYIELVSNDELGQIDIMPVLCHTSSYQTLFKLLEVYLEKIVEYYISFEAKPSGERSTFTLSNVNPYWAKMIDNLNENIEKYLSTDENHVQFLENMLYIFSIVGNVQCLEPKYNSKFVLFDLVTEHIVRIFSTPKMENLSQEDELLCLVKLSKNCIQVLEEWNSINLNHIFTIYEFLTSPWRGKYRYLFWDELKPLCYDALIYLLHSGLNIKELNDFSLGLVEVLFEIATYEEHLFDKCFLSLVICLIHDELNRESYFTTYIKTFLIKDRIDIVINSSIARNVLPCFISNNCIILRNRNGIETNCVHCDLSNNECLPKIIHLKQYLNFIGLSFMKVLISNETDNSMKSELIRSLERYVFHVPALKSTESLKTLPECITSVVLSHNNLRIKSALKCFLFDGEGKFSLKNANIVMNNLLPMFNDDDTALHLTDLADFLVDVAYLSKTFLFLTIKVLLFVIFDCTLTDFKLHCLKDRLHNLLCFHNMDELELLIMYEKELSEIWVDIIINNIQNETWNTEDTLKRIADFFDLKAKSLLEFRFTPYMIAYLFTICTKDETNFILTSLSDLLLLPVKDTLIKCFPIVYPLVYFMDNEVVLENALNYIEVICEKKLDILIYYSFKKVKDKLELKKGLSKRPVLSGYKEYCRAFKQKSDLVCNIIMNSHKHLKVLRFFKKYVFKDESALKKGRDMLLSYTVGFLTFVDAKLSSTTSSLFLIKSCLRSIPNLIKILGVTYVSKIRIKLLATLRTGLPRHFDSHPKECLEAWRYYLHSIDLSTIGPYLTTIVTLLFQLFNKYPIDVSKILHFLVVKNGHLYEDYLPELFFIKKSHIPELNEVWRKIKKVSKSLDIVDGMKMALVHIKSGAVESRIHSLKYLYHQLIIKRSDVFRLINQCDKLPKLFHQVMDCLMMNAHYGNSEVRAVSVSCLGAMGAINPARFSYGFRDEHIKGYIDVKTEDFAYLMIMELTKSLQKSDDSQTYNTIANSIQELLKLYFPCQEPSKVDVFLTKFSHNERNILCSLLETKYICHIQEPVLVRRKHFGLGAKPGQSIFDWATSWASELVALMPSGSFVMNVFKTCLPGILTDSETMESLLPHILLQAILSCSKDDVDFIATEMKYILQFQHKNLLIAPNTSEIFEIGILETVEVELMNCMNYNDTNQKGVAVVLDLIDFLFNYFSQLKISKQSGEHVTKISVFLEKFPANFISLKSYTVNDYCRSLFYLERSYSDSSSVQNLSPLRNIYAKLNDIDGLLGVIRTCKSIPTMEESILNNVVCGNIQEALCAYEILAAKHKTCTAYCRALILCYLQTNSLSSALHLYDSFFSRGNYEVSFCSEIIQTACCNLMFDDARNFIEEHLPDEMRSDSTWNIDISLAYLEFFDLNFGSLGRKIDSIRHTIGDHIADISNTTIGAYRQGYTHIVKLHILDELEMFAQLLKDIFQPNSYLRLPSLFEKMNLRSRLQILPSNGYFVERIMSSRIQMLSIINEIKIIPPTVKPIIRSQLGITYLKSAKIARKNLNFQLCSTYLALAEQYQPLGLFIEKAKVHEAKHDTDTAISILKQGIILNSESPNILTDVTLLKLSARAKLLIARYNEENMNVDYNESTKSYQDAIDTHPNEKNYVYLGKYLYQIHSADISDRSASKCEIQITAIKCFGKSLLYGCKFIYQSMFCMISLYLDYAARFKINQIATKHIKQAGKLYEETMDKMDVLMDEYFEVHPTYMYMAVFSQLLSRINHPLPKCQQSLIQIISKVAVDFPHQALWMMAPIWKTDDDVHNKLGCKILSKMIEIEKKSKSQSTILKHYNIFNDLVDILINICNKKVPKDKVVVPLKSISLKLNVLLRSHPNKIMIPVQAHRTISLPKCKHFLNAKDRNSHNPFPSICARTLPYFTDVEKDVQVLVSMQRPKKLVFRGSDGHSYPFMCKPMDDLRLDSRIMEFSSVVNMYLQRDPASCDRSLNIRTYSVVPINPANGIIEWVPNLTGYRGVILKMFKMKSYKIPSPIDIKARLDACKTPEQKKKLFEETLLPLHPPVLHKWFFHQFSTPDSWYLARKSFVRTAAVMSIIGYVVGLGDRHGENILLDTISGDIMHVDFNCLFGRGEFFQIPEVVPFRLTQNIVKAMGSTGIEGYFMKTCEITNKVIRNNADQLLYVLKPFLYDPKLQKIPNAEDRARANLNTITKKMTGFVITPVRKTPALSVEGQVRCLVAEATSSKNLSQMFLGWNSFL